MLRVVELQSAEASGGEVAAAFATQFLQLMSATVTVVEPPSGSALRARAATLDDAQFEYLHRGKRIEHIDLGQDRGRARLLEVVRDADAVVEGVGGDGLSALGLDLAGLRAANPRLVITSVSPFGSSGPRAGWKSSELVVQAMGGLVAASGRSDGPPTRLAGSQASHVAGVAAAMQTLAAVRGVHANASGAVHLDISIQEVVASHWTREVGRYAYTGQETPRASGRLGLQGFPHTVPSADGWLFLLAIGADWESLAIFLGLLDFVGGDWSDVEYRVEHWEEIRPHFEAAVQQRGRYEWFADAAERGYTFAPIDDALSVLESPQLRSRDFFGRMRLEDGRTVPCPGLPFTFAGRREEWDQPSREAGDDEDAATTAQRGSGHPEADRS